MSRSYPPARVARVTAFAEKVKALNADELIESYRRAAIQEIVCGINTKADSTDALAILGGEIRERLLRNSPERKDRDT